MVRAPTRDAPTALDSRFRGNDRIGWGRPCPCALALVQCGPAQYAGPVPPGEGRPRKDERRAMNATSAPAAAGHSIALFAALDTKADEARLVRDIIVARGHRAVVVNTGVVGEPGFAPDVGAAAVAEAGGTSLAALRERADRGEAIAAMARGAAVIAAQLRAEGRLDGVVGLGGSAGTAVGSAAMRALPVGVPKVLASTVASGNVAPYVGTKDVAMLYSVVDIAGLNRLSRAVLTNAAGAVCGAVEAAAQHAHRAAGDEKPLLAASMFGNTTELVDAARAVFEQQGYEVLVFHATGSGGQTMEGLIRDGFIAGVYDVTTTEWQINCVVGCSPPARHAWMPPANGAFPR